MNLTRMAVFYCVVTVSLIGCGNNATFSDADEVGQSVGEATQSIDEAMTGGGFGWLETPNIHRREFEPTRIEKLIHFVLPEAHAAACGAMVSAFTACATGVKTRAFSSCSVGLLTVDGSVTLTFSDPACMMTTGASVTRDANFTITGRAGGTLTVSTPIGGGQRVTKTAAGFDYAVDGIERVMKNTKGNTVFDIVTKTLSPISISGTSRANRTINGGKLQIRHNLAKYTTEVAPSNVKWDTTCNCPTSGKFDGTSTPDSGTGKNFSLEFISCGRATVTVDGTSKSIDLDRCIAL